MTTATALGRWHIHPWQDDQDCLFEFFKMPALVLINSNKYWLVNVRIPLTKPGQAFQHEQAKEDQARQY